MNPMLTVSLLAAIPAQLPPAHEREQAYWEVQSPAAGRSRARGRRSGFPPDGRLAVSTRRGEVRTVEDALAENASAARFHLLAEGLQEGLGLAVVGGEIYVVQRGELSRLGDADAAGSSDGVSAPDVIATITNGWGLSGNYHEFAYGLPVDAQGNFYVSLNVGFLDPKWWHGKSLAPWRGWVIRIAPDGTTSPVACGFRSPCGIGINSRNEIFVTDNQGDWVASTPLYHVKDGAFYGHPASLDWTDEYRASQTKASDTVPPARERTPPAIWIPYKWSRSAGNMVEDATGGRFGPFGGDLFVAELTNGMVVRADLEKVRGEYQGACFLFRQRVGSATRVLFAPDGSMIVGFTNRGWGGYPPGQGLARIRWTGKTPMEIHHVHLLQDGFELALTEPLAAGLVLAPEQVSVQSYDYDYWWEYGSPERHTTSLPVGRVEVSSDRRTLSLRGIPLVPATCARVVLSGVVSASGQPLLHDEFSYTIIQLPEGPRTNELVAKLVPPPPPRESGMEGWVRLTFGDALDAWISSGWKLCDAEIDPADRHTIRTSEGDDALVNVGAGTPSPYVSKYEFGDAKVHVEFMLPEGGNSGVYLQGRYEVQLLDSSGKKDLEFGDCGGIYRGENWGGAAPLANGFREPGVWQDLDIVFEAPRFDPSGKKVRNARFVRVLPTTSSRTKRGGPRADARPALRRRSGARSADVAGRPLPGRLSRDPRLPARSRGWWRLEGALRRRVDRRLASRRNGEVGGRRRHPAELGRSRSSVQPARRLLRFRPARADAHLGGREQRAVLPRATHGGVARGLRGADQQQLSRPAEDRQPLRPLRGARAARPARYVVRVRGARPRRHRRDAHHDPRQRRGRDELRRPRAPPRVRAHRPAAAQRRLGPAVDLRQPCRRGG
jgi:glucose/arabinose dehydrogenase